MDDGRSRRVIIMDERLEEEVKDRKESRLRVSSPGSSCERSKKVDFVSDEEPNPSIGSSELPFGADSVNGPPAVIHTSGRESPESNAIEFVLLFVEDLVDLSSEVDLRSNNCEVKDRKEDRRRRALSRGVFCTIMDTGRGRRLIASEKAGLSVKEAVWSMASVELERSLWDEDAWPQERVVNARNPDLKKSE